VTIFPARITLHQDAIENNVRVIARVAPSTQMIAVVKGNAYGHGRRLIARSLLDLGTKIFGVSEASEAVQLRREVGSGPRILTWLSTSGQSWADVIGANIEVGAYSVGVLEDIASGGKAKVHLKVDTGMGRGGATIRDFEVLAKRAAELQKLGRIEVVGVWSHLANADSFDDAHTNEQVAIFESALDILGSVGIKPGMRHLAATGGAFWHPQTHYDAVRIGIGLYGMSPNPDKETAADLGLQAVMELCAPLVLVKRLEAGEPVSYGSTWRATERNWVGLVPIGYADGIARAASNRGPVTVNGVRTQIIGRVCMDQFVVDLGVGDRPYGVEGDTAELIGGKGPMAEEWASASGTINYEVTTRLASYIPREVVSVGK